MNKINFRNVVQAALFEVEISGQISDGYWENTTPHNHYKKWCEAEVGVNPKQLGRNFWAQRDNYDFTALIEHIGDRMVNICNMAENNTSLEVIRDFYDWKDYDTDNLTSDYWRNKKKEFKLYFNDDAGYNEVLTGSYDLKKLKAELEDMKAIIKIIMNGSI